MVPLIKLQTYENVNLFRDGKIHSISKSIMDNKNMDDERWTHYVFYMYTPKE